MTNLNRVNVWRWCRLVRVRWIPPPLSAVSGSPATPRSGVSGGLRRVWRCLWLIASPVARERKFRRFAPDKTRRCRSSVVEHSLGKGEVESPILSGSTSFSLNNIKTLQPLLHFHELLVEKEISAIVQIEPFLHIRAGSDNAH
jgi:hypothetical protein